MAKLGLEYLTSNKLIAYPFDSDTKIFADDVDSVVLNNVFSITSNTAGLPTSTITRDFFSDAVVTVDRDVQDWFLYGIDHTIDGNIRLAFKTSTIQNPIISSYIDLNNIKNDLQSKHYYVLSIQQQDIQSIRYTFRATLDKGFIAYIDKAFRVKNLQAIIFKDLKFDPSVVDRTPPKVNSIQLWNGNYTSKSPLIDLDVRLLGGFNVDISTTPEDDDYTSLEITASPGGGEGTVPCDVLNPEVIDTSLNGITPDANGQIIIEGDDCYTIYPNINSNTIQIQSSCYACCTCNDYNAVSSYLQKLLDRSKNIFTVFNNYLQTYTQLVEKFETEFIPEKRKGYLSITAAKGINYENLETKVKSDNHAVVTVKLENKGEGDLTGDIIVSHPGKFLGGYYRQEKNILGSLANGTWSGSLPSGQTLSMVFRISSYGGTLVGNVNALANFSINGLTGVRSYIETANLIL